MPTIAIVGAGPGLGLSIAKVFGRHGFTVALIARRQQALDQLAEQLGDQGTDAAGFAADVMDRPSLADALTRVEQRYGGIDVLEYSPVPHNPVAGMTFVEPTEVTVENLQPHIDYLVHGAVTATRQVLPGMLARGNGTLLFSTGHPAEESIDKGCNVRVGVAALRFWVLNLHHALAGAGVYAAHVPLAVSIGSGGHESHPDTIAELYWHLHIERKEPEHLYSVE